MALRYGTNLNGLYYVCFSAGHTLLKSKSSTSLQSAEDSDETGLDTH